MSHPEWVRGLKRVRTEADYTDALSHPEWVRGLKHQQGLALSRIPRRTPSGCVD